MKTAHYMITGLGLFVLALTIVALHGNQAQASQQTESKWRIVNYWSEWCAPCRREIPMLNELNEALSSGNVTIVGVNFDEDPREMTLSIAKEMGIDFPTLTVEEVSELQLPAPFVLPATYILSPDNEVVAKMIGEQTKESLRAQLLNLGLSVETE